VAYLIISSLVTVFKKTADIFLAIESALFFLVSNLRTRLMGNHGGKEVKSIYSSFLTYFGGIVRSKYIFFIII